MTQDQIIQIQRQVGIPDSWVDSRVSIDLVPVQRPRHFISGASFTGELKGRITINADASGWIRIHSEAGAIMIPHQVLSVDGSAL